MQQIFCDLSESHYMRGLGFPDLCGEGEGRAAEVTGLRRGWLRRLVKKLEEIVKLLGGVVACEEVHSPR